MKRLLLAILCAAALPALGQQLNEHYPQGHSHNDYLQAAPFALAYHQNFGSMEADVFLVNDTLFIAHERSQIDKERTFENLYLRPILKAAAEKKGKFMEIKNCKLLVDLKTKGEPALQALTKLLAPYDAIFGEKEAYRF